jgi:hypothetical protein
VWTTKIVTDGERNCSILLRGRVSDFELGEHEPSQPVLTAKDLKFFPDTLKVEHIIFSIGEGYEVMLFWDGEPVLPLAGRGRLDFSETRGLSGGVVLLAQITRTKAEHNPLGVALLVLDLLKQKEA